MATKLQLKALRGLVHPSNHISASDRALLAVQSRIGKVAEHVLVQVETPEELKRRQAADDILRTVVAVLQYAEDEGLALPAAIAASPVSDETPVVVALELNQSLARLIEAWPSWSLAEEAVYFLSRLLALADLLDVDLKAAVERLARGQAECG